MSAGGKGSGRRPTLVPEAEVADSWKTIFGKNKGTKDEGKQGNEGAGSNDQGRSKSSEIAPDKSNG